MTKRHLLLLLTCSMMLLLMTGCGKKTESWAYIHEPEKEAMALYDDGKAVYKGDSYSYTRDDNFFHLTKKGKTLDLRYAKEGDGLLLYEKTAYKPVEGKPHEGIVGSWVQDNGWSYVFTPDGQFSEEDIFFGHYSVDEENACIRLMYDDPIEDAYLYYDLTDEGLVIDYPWPMTKTQAN